MIKRLTNWEYLIKNVRRLFFLFQYFRNPPWDTNISPPELMAFLETHPPGRALDLGCGTGTNAITLAKHGWQVIGVDFVGRAIRKAQRKAEQAGVRVDFRVGDVTRLEGIAGKFDLILDIGCFHSLPPQGRVAYVENLNRLLAPGGTFLLYAFVIEDQQPGSGLVEADINSLNRHLRLINRQDGTEQGRIASAWFTYTRREP